MFLSQLTDSGYLGESVLNLVRLSIYIKYFKILSENNFSLSDLCDHEYWAMHGHQVENWSYSCQINEYMYWIWWDEVKYIFFLNIEWKPLIQMTFVTLKIWSRSPSSNLVSALPCASVYQSWWDLVMSNIFFRYWAETILKDLMSLKIR